MLFAVIASREPNTKKSLRLRRLQRVSRVHDEYTSICKHTFLVLANVSREGLARLSAIPFGRGDDSIAVAVFGLEFGQDVAIPFGGKLMHLDLAVSVFVQS